MPSSVRRDPPDLNLSSDVTLSIGLFEARDTPADNGPTRRLTCPSSRRGSRRGPTRRAARRAALCVALATTTLLAPLAPALADEARDVVVEIDFTWTSRDLSTVPTAEDRDAVAAEYFLVLTPNPDSGLPNLGGHCVALNTVDKTSGGSAESGDCVFRDIDGDALYEHYTGSAPDGDTPFRGQSMISGGTGKFAGVSGELEIEARYYASPIEGTYQGSGIKKGTLHRPAS